MDRELKLNNWLNHVLKTPHQRILLAGDASARRYFRIYVDGKPYVAMDAPPPEIPKVFADIALVLAAKGLQVPKVMHADFEQGFLLLSDLGDKLYLNELNDVSADQLYQNAFEGLLKIQQCTSPLLPAFDRDFFNRQVGLFEEWYLKKHKALSAMDYEKAQAILNPVYEKLFEVWQSQPQVFVHRDYHSRNLMVLSNQDVGILDFQDAMFGPITYDLVSLLQDCYIAWPRDRVRAWVFNFYKQIEKAEHINIRIEGQSIEERFFEFLRWFDLTGLQRHLKNLGIFARLHYRDNKSGYLKDIPQVLKYIFETCQRYAVLKPLLNFFEMLEESQKIEEMQNTLEV